MQGTKFVGFVLWGRGLRCKDVLSCVHESAQGSNTTYVSASTYGLTCRY